MASLFQAYSSTIDHFLDDTAARRALIKAILSSSVWIYYLFSASLPDLSITAGFLTTERFRRTRHHDHGSDVRGGGSIAITAVYTQENYRRRGVAESLVRTATRHYLGGDEACESVNVYIDPRSESTCRLFERVGFGIGERECAEDVPVKMISDCLVVQIREQDELGHSSTSNTQGVASASEMTSTDDIQLEISEADKTPLQESTGNGNDAIDYIDPSTSTSIPSSVATLSSPAASLLAPVEIDVIKKTDDIDTRVTVRSSEEWQVVALV